MRRAADHQGLELYREQHRELLATAAALGLAAPGEARAILARLAGKLTVHLQMEDCSLYPELLASQDAAVREAALRFQAAMGSIRGSVEGLFRRWLAPEAILHSPEAFSAEVGPMLRTLAQRIAAEDGELFRLAERR